MSNENVFRYSYSAKQHEEVCAIRSKYLPREESKLDELKRLDSQVSNAGLPQSLAAGIVGCLIFGLGLCFALQALQGGMTLGVLLCLCGAALMTAAHPIHRSCSRKAKAKHRTRILELAAELCGEFPTESN